MYIHEQPNWPAFTWDRAMLAELLSDVRHLQGRLLGRMETLGFDLREQATLRALTEDVTTTSAIEGQHLDLIQVRSSLARRMGIDVGALPPVDRNVEGIAEVLLDATRHFERPLTAERLFGWQAALFPDRRSGLQRVTVGAWRTEASGPMQVVSGGYGREVVHFEAPSHDRLAVEMDTFLAWFNRPSDEDPVIKSAIAHLWFLTIHPFDDGNGRIARAISDLQLARCEGTSHRFYSMSAQIQAARSEYYRILERTQKGTLDLTAWIEWYLLTLRRAIEASASLLEVVLAKAHFWNTHRTTQLNERQRLMLNRLLDGFEGKLTTSKWAKLAKCSSDTALRDITDLLDRQILIKDGAGGRSTGYRLVNETT